MHRLSDAESRPVPSDAADEAVRVRFAPSPTGGLHIGGLRTALFNWLFARRHGGKIVLRIDDTDRERSKEEHLRSILNGFRWLGVTFDEGVEEGGPYGPYRQSERLPLYRAALERLVAEGKAYPCYCTAEELEESRKRQLAEGKTPRYPGTCRNLTPEERAAREAEGRKPVFRLKVDLDRPVVVHDVIRGDVVFPPDQLDDFVIVKSDGMPTYHFASCVDDAEMRITHIIRAEEHLSNTPRHVVLFRALGAPVPTFAHVPMILAPDRTKLSKRHGATSVEEFRALGFLPEAIVNYSLLLGYTPEDGSELFRLEELAPTFDLARIAKHPAVYDVGKLRWMNAHYLRTLPLERVYAYAEPFFKAAGYLPEEPDEAAKKTALERIEAVRERVATLVELVDAVSYFYRPVEAYDEKGVAKHFKNPAEVAERLRLAAERLAAVEPWTRETTEAAYRALIAELGISGGALIHPTRLALSGRTVGPGLFHIMVLLGKAETIRRLEAAIDWLKARA
ncbi:MAG: glutamate--tRNA ligase [Hydrogenibacillus schlegelii]|uniref:Glutamate--tRNA ligase n=1 Tax=Hydrogenibacillus schlegelii TaxID=1484 RepID=A0A947G874_HYDSH|nr:glutamate--tRNA ligase [Hydrogenibacillus schlegelii]